MGNKRSNTKKPKQKQQNAGRKGGAASFEEAGNPQPVRKKKNKQ